MTKKEVLEKVQEVYQLLDEAHADLKATLSDMEDLESSVKSVARNLEYSNEKIDKAFKMLEEIPENASEIEDEVPETD